MKKQPRGNRGVVLIVVFLCVSLVFAALWGIVSGFSKLMQYSQNATIDHRPDPEEQENAEPDDLPQEEEVLPKNTFHADGFYEIDGIRYYNGGDYIGVAGVDVSSYQSDIDWEAVQAAGIEFAIVRVGYRGYGTGNLDLDNCFQEHIEGAIAAGLDVGVYFFSQALNPEEAAEEARYVLEQIEPYTLHYPIVYDWEEVPSPARTDDMNMLMLTSCAQAFCQVVEDAGYQASVYFNQAYGYEQLNLVSLKDYDFWLAEYDPVPSFAYEVQMWQYTNEGVVPGIDGPVDLNIAFQKKSS